MAVVFQEPGVWYLLATANLIGLGSYVVHGIYRQINQTRISRQFGQRRRAVVWGIVLLVIVNGLLPSPFFNFGNLGFFLVIFAPASMLTASGLLHLHRALARNGWGVRRVLIVGTGSSARLVDLRLDNRPELCYLVVGFVRNDLDPYSESKKDEMPAMGGIADIPQLIDELQVDGVIVATEEAIPERYNSLREVCLQKNVSLRLVAPRIDNILEFGHIYDVTGIPLASKRSFYNTRLYPVIKRSLDFSLSGIALLLLLPLFLLIAVGIKISSRGPVFSFNGGVWLRAARRFLSSSSAVCARVPTRQNMAI
jgi:FlaA1/EpsC-like NDP-sugar epimerase